jgi:hypothetical protein
LFLSHFVCNDQRAASAWFLLLLVRQMIRKVSKPLLRWQTWKGVQHQSQRRRWKQQRKAAILNSSITCGRAFHWHFGDSQVNTRLLLREAARNCRVFEKRSKLALNDSVYLTLLLVNKSNCDAVKQTPDFGERRPVVGGPTDAQHDKTFEPFWHLSPGKSNANRQRSLLQNASCLTMMGTNHVLCITTTAVPLSSDYTIMNALHEPEPSEMRVVWTDIRNKQLLRGAHGRDVTKIQRRKGAAYIGKFPDTPHE